MRVGVRVRFAGGSIGSIFGSSRIRAGLIIIDLGVRLRLRIGTKARRVERVSCGSEPSPNPNCCLRQTVNSTRAALARLLGAHVWAAAGGHRDVIAAFGVRGSTGLNSGLAVSGQDSARVSARVLAGVSSNVQGRAPGGDLRIKNSAGLPVESGLGLESWCQLGVGVSMFVVVDMTG